MSKPGIAMVSTGRVPVSEMASGVDKASPRGAISAKGKTVAVFGTGVGLICPKENSRL
ncbi:MAG TPA: DNA-processing protein DprA [Candidatus Sulfotelmatobacter sp.]